jgi:hypothetical protein
VVEENHEFEDTLDNREILSQKNKKTKKTPARAEFKW